MGISNLMRVTIRLDKPIDSHAHVTIFVNGANAGQLCLSAEEFHQLKFLIGHHVTWISPVGED